MVSDRSMLTEKQYQIVHSILDFTAPIIRANGTDPESVKEFTYCLLYVSGALADKIGISPAEFRNLAMAAFEEAKEPKELNN